VIQNYLSELVVCNMDPEMNTMKWGVDMQSLNFVSLTYSETKPYFTVAL